MACIFAEFFAALLIGAHCAVKYIPYPKGKHGHLDLYVWASAVTVNEIEGQRLIREKLNLPVFAPVHNPERRVSFVGHVGHTLGGEVVLPTTNATGYGVGDVLPHLVVEEIDSGVALGQVNYHSKSIRIDAFIDHTWRGTFSEIAPPFMTSQ